MDEAARHSSRRESGACGVRLFILLALAACKTSDTDGYPVNPGTGTDMNKLPDAPLAIDGSTGDGGAMIDGRVCLVSDLRALSTCAPTGAGNIVVTLGTRTATTSDSGAFSIATPSGSNLVWRATGVNIVKTVTPFGASTTIPAISIADYNDLQLANSIVLQAGEGSIVARVVRNSVAVTGAVAGVTPIAQFPTKYDGTTKLGWTELSTRTAGTAWIAGAGVGSPSLAITPPTGTGDTNPVRVEDGAITYVTIDLP